LICGALFGFVLENAGFGSPRKLTAQFSLTDWSVFKVMFTAIVVAAFGLWGLRAAGLIPADALYVPTSLVVASA
ncbi:MAG: transporter, partial [Ottowia sp.]|nr:transporter [Ottowia sp.]